MMQKVDARLDKEARLDNMEKELRLIKYMTGMGSYHAAKERFEDAAVLSWRMMWEKTLQRDEQLG